MRRRQPQVALTVHQTLVHISRRYAAGLQSPRQRRVGLFNVSFVSHRLHLIPLPVQHPTLVGNDPFTLIAVHFHLPDMAPHLRMLVQVNDFHAFHVGRITVVDAKVQRSQLVSNPYMPCRHGIEIARMNRLTILLPQQQTHVDETALPRVQQIQAAVVRANPHILPAVGLNHRDTVCRQSVGLRPVVAAERGETIAVIAAQAVPRCYPY